jgi:perosamine synthetase
LDLERLKINRHQFIEALRKAGIGTSVHFIPLHLHPYYRNEFGYTAKDFFQASAVYERIISLPIYPNMTHADADRVVSAVRSIAKQYRQ